MRNRMVIAALVALVAGGLLAAVPASAGSDGRVPEYIVLYADGASATEAHAAIAIPAHPSNESRVAQDRFQRDPRWSRAPSL